MNLTQRQKEIIFSLVEAAADAESLVSLLDSLLRAGSRITNHSYGHLSDDIEHQVRQLREALDAFEQISIFPIERGSLRLFCVGVDQMRIVHPPKPKEQNDGTIES